MNNLSNTFDLLRKTFPESRFDKVKEEWIKDIESKYSEIPFNLKSLYNEIGYGTVGDAYYSIHVLLEPDEIYDPITAEELKGKLIVGDDFAGCCHAYDANNGWEFGCIESSGEFESYDGNYEDFVDYLRKLALNKKENSN